MQETQSFCQWTQIASFRSGRFVNFYVFSVNPLTTSSSSEMVMVIVKDEKNTIKRYNVNKN